MTTTIITSDILNGTTNITGFNEVVVAPGVLIFEDGTRAFDMSGTGRPTLANYGTIISGASSSTINVNSDSAIILNHGTISNVSTTSSVTALFDLSGGNSQSATADDLIFINHGTMEALNDFFHDESPNGAFNLIIENTDLMQADRESVFTSDSPDLNDVRINNSGTMIGGLFAVDGNGTAFIDNSGTIEMREIDLNAAQGGILVNSGTITLRNAFNNSVGAIEGGDAVEEITNSGTLNGGMFLLSENDIVTNSGDITGFVNLGTGADTLTNSGTIASSVLNPNSNDGNDTIYNTGHIGGDVGLGGGDDLIDTRGGTIAGEVSGGFGNDTFYIDDASIDLDDFFNGGTDHVFSEAATYSLQVHFENLTLLGGEDINGFGNNGANFIAGNTGDNLIQGFFGEDTISGNFGDDTLGGGFSDDSLDGGGGNDFVQGGQGNDTVIGNLGDDTLRGAAGNDQLLGGDGDDNMAGGLGNDVLLGQDGDDMMFGQGGADAFNGGEGEDYIHGGAGGDTLSGANGDDTLVGGGGADQLTGGNGADVFEFQSFAQSRLSGFDTITDFQIGSDLIDLTGLVPGQINYQGFGAVSANGAAELLIREPGGGPNSVVFVDVNGDGTQDFRINITGVTGLSETDFLL
ncbi:calcium-binding protein [uncultured Tateyamaria sp.]|uniref:calcium-binding protein n=1 Tax=uncultured Tateyamaria sp. TaxID=455651 RepID=UPI002619A107|nr:calcium-binding protein [uncultured Tateyamaria sp.]